jgi:YVTN family beta-propeller protein
MKLFRFLLLVLLAPTLSILFLSACTWGGEPPDRFYILDKAGNLSVVDAKTLTVTGKLPVGPDKLQVFVDPDNRFLYVLHDMPRSKNKEIAGPNQLTVHEIDSQKLIATIPVGYGADQIGYSKDHRYAICVAKGINGTMKTDPQYGQVTIVDLAAHTVIAELPLRHDVGNVVVDDDLSRMFMLSPGSLAPFKKACLSAFDVESEKLLGEIEFDGFPTSMTLSRDGKYLYMLDTGQRHTMRSSKFEKDVNGLLSVIDVETVQVLKSHDVGKSPHMLQVDPQEDFVTLLGSGDPNSHEGRFYVFRGSELANTSAIGNKPQFVRKLKGLSPRVLVTHDRLHFVNEDGSLAQQAVPLNSQFTPGVLSSVPLDGYLSGIRYLPEVNKLVMSVRQGRSYGVPTSKVAFVDLKDHRVERIVTTGRGGVKVGRVVGGMALVGLEAYGLFSLPGLIASESASLIYSRALFKPSTFFVDLMTSPDGKFVYVLNMFSYDVTIIDSYDGKVFDYIPVGAGDGRIFRAPGGRFVCVVTSSKVTLIDPTTNKLKLEYDIKGYVRGYLPDKNGHRILTLGSKSLHVFSADKGELLGSIDGLKDPVGLILPILDPQPEDEDTDLEAAAQ